MVEQNWEVEIKWENNVAFSVIAKKNGNTPITIVCIDENGHIAAMWPKVSGVAESWLKLVLADIGKEMSKP